MIHIKKGAEKTQSFSTQLERKREREKVLSEGSSASGRKRLVLRKGAYQARECDGRKEKS